MSRVSVNKKVKSLGTILAEYVELKQKETTEEQKRTCFLRHQGGQVVMDTWQKLNALLHDYILQTT